MRTHDADRHLANPGIGRPARDAKDHGTHEAIYVVDPDGNSLELMWDRPFDEWPRDGAGHVDMSGVALDLEGLSREAEG